MAINRYILITLKTASEVIDWDILFSKPSSHYKRGAGDTIFDSAPSWSFVPYILSNAFKISPFGHHNYESLAVVF